MHHQGLSPTERHTARARAKMVYETIQGKLGSHLKGNIVAIEAESGEYFIGETILDAASKARAKYPDRMFHFFRIGFPTVYVWR
jgi:hypothetical protein